MSSTMGSSGGRGQVKVVDELGVLRVDVRALELAGERELVAAGRPRALEDRVALELLDAREARVALLDDARDVGDDGRMARELVGRQRPPPATAAAAAGRARSARRCRAARRRSTTTCAITASVPRIACSMLTGDMFLPAELMMMSFLRPTTHR